MPESIKDRCTRSHEHIFLFSKSKRYFYDWQAIAEPIAPTTALRKKNGRGVGKYSSPVPGQPQTQNINKPREKGSITDEMISPVRAKRDVPIRQSWQKPAYWQDVRQAGLSLTHSWAAVRRGLRQNGTDGTTSALN